MRRTQLLNKYNMTPRPGQPDLKSWFVNVTASPKRSPPTPDESDNKRQNSINWIIMVNSAL